MDIISNVKEYFNESNLLVAIMVTVISNYTTELSVSFLNDLVLPILDRDGDGDNDPDINKLRNYTFNMNGIVFKVGAFGVSLIRFIMILIIIALFIHLIKNL
jgi:large-conductance mechanosensitive channel